MSQPNGQRSPSVVIVERSQMSSELMAAALRRSRYRMEVVGCTTDKAGIRSILSKKAASVALIGALKDGHRAAFDVTRELRTSNPDMSIIMLLDSMERSAVVDAFRAGAVGILCRDEPFHVLCKCIQSVHQGQVWAGSEVLRFALEALGQTPSISKFRRSPSKAPKTLLTKREKDIVNSVTEGLTNRDISRRLSLSEHTVRNYLFRIFNKLGTSNRLELALYALHPRGANQTGGTFGG
jgi:two-component system nitrate/nitrite response regulator NarL